MYVMVIAEKNIAYKVCSTLKEGREVAQKMADTYDTAEIFRLTPDGGLGKPIEFYQSKKKKR